MFGTSLAVQWLRLRTSTAGGAGLISGQGTKIPHAAWRGQKKKKKKSTGSFFGSVPLFSSLESPLPSIVN